MSEFLINEQEVNLLFTNYGQSLLGGGAGIEQHQVGAETTVGTQSHNETAVVASQHTDAVALLNIAVTECSRQGSGALVQLLVGQRAAIINNRSVVRIAAGCNAEETSWQEVPAVDGT